MTDVYRDGDLIAEALAEADVADARSREEIEGRLALIRQERAGAVRALDRYFAAFEEGSLAPADCQERIGMLKERIETLEAQERRLAEAGISQASDPIAAEDVASGRTPFRNC